MQILTDAHPFCGVLVDMDAGMAEAGAAHGELEEGGPSGGENGGQGWEGLGAEVANKGGETIF